MDIQHLLDRLEQVLSESPRFPLTANLLVNEDKIFNVIDQMRAAIPEEIKRANRVEAEKERIMAQAKEEAERIRGLARQEAGELVKRDAVVAAAQQRADNILERARRESEVLKRDADAYAMEVLSKLEDNLLSSLGVVRNGLRKIEADAAAPEPAPNETKP